jgi:hypothetical protein
VAVVANWVHSFFGCSVSSDGKRRAPRTATKVLPSAIPYCQNSLDCIDILKFGIPEEQEVARLLESFNQAVITSKEIGRYLSDARPEKDDAPQAKVNWSSQDDSFGMR